MLLSLTACTTGRLDLNATRHQFRSFHRGGRSDLVLGDEVTSHLRLVVAADESHRAIVGNSVQSRILAHVCHSLISVAVRSAQGV